MRHFHTKELSDIVADAASLPVELTRHEMGEGVAVSFLYNGNEKHPGTCQWRVVAQHVDQVRTVVLQLMEILAARGVQCKPARFNGSLSYFQDAGPWEANQRHVHDGLGQ